MKAMDFATESTTTPDAAGQSIERIPQGECLPAGGKFAVWSEA